jgi:uncharacterized protein YceH (UPF0502 family)
VELSPVEVRVIGCLVEKELTTPQYYPLTLNALVAACNQTSNRSPVVTYDERTVEQALATLREKGLTRIVYSRSNRAARYRHVLDEMLGLEPRDTAVLSVLMLRGAQTVGEIRTRTERMTEFESLGDVEATLDALASRGEPLVVRLDRQPGQKEARFAQLLGGEAAAAEALAAATVRSAAPSSTAGASQLRELADEVTLLRQELDDLRREMADLRALLE